MGLVAQSCLTPCNPVDCSPPGPSVHGDSPGKNTGVDCHALLQGIFLPRDRTQVLPVQAEILPTEPPGKPKNTAMGSLSLLQGIFQTQESNRGLLHCRRVLYQLSYRGSPSPGGMPQNCVPHFGEQGVREMTTQFSSSPGIASFNWESSH